MNIQEKGADRLVNMSSFSEDVDLGGKTIRCRVHTWAAPAEMRRPVRFIGPEVENPAQQLFLPEPLAQFWAATNPKKKSEKKAKAKAIVKASAKAEAKAKERLADYFEDAFEVGYRVLREFHPDGSSVPPRPVFELMKALFRNREAGFVRQGRRLDSVAEIVRPGSDGTMSLIVPGLAENPYEIEEGGRDWNAWMCVKQALRDAHAPPSARTLVQQVRDVVGAKSWEEVADRASASPKPLLAADRLVWRSTTDRLWTGGQVRSTRAGERAAVVNAVGGGLLAGEELLWYDLVSAVQNRPLLLRLVERLLYAASRRRPDEFDRWLGVEREHGFRRLLGSEFGDAERSVVRAIYRAIVWSAIQFMARCYAAFVFRVWIDFELHHADGRPTPEASWLFREQNLPHLAFAGLPLAFLTPGQILWVWRPLRHLWESGAAAWAKYRPAAERLAKGEPITTEPVPTDLTELQGLDGTLYDTCRALLVVYADAANTVRKADRDSKAVARGSKAIENQFPEIDEDAAEERAAGRQVQRGTLERVETVPFHTVPFDPSLPPDAPPMEDDICFECHEHYALLARGEVRGKQTVVRVECLCGENVFKVTDDRDV